MPEEKYKRFKIWMLRIASAFAYSGYHYRAIQTDPALSDIWLGLAAGLIGVLVGGIFDHFYFNVESFHATTTAVMILMGLMRRQHGWQRGNTGVMRSLF